MADRDTEWTATYSRLEAENLRLENQVRKLQSSILWYRIIIVVVAVMSLFLLIAYAASGD
jgi:hypothetical protein